MTRRERRTSTRYCGRHGGIHGDAATMMFAHGQVYIDGFCVPAPWASGHWTQGQLAGRMLKCVRGETRLYGRGRHAAQFEQMALA
jgi:hypothetical protein